MLNKSNLARYFRSKRVWAFSAAVVLAAVAIPNASSGFEAAASSAASAGSASLPLTPGPGASP